MSLKQARQAALAVAALALVSQPMAALAKTKVILSNDTQALSLKGKSFELLKTEIEKRLGDKAAVELHQSGALFDQKTQIQGLQLGGAHMIAPTVGIYSSITPKVNALLLPFLLPNEKAVDAAMNDEVVRASFVPDLEKKNVLPVAIWVNGPRNIGYKRKEPILTPDGMKGLKIRVQSAPIYVDTMKAFGANVIAMSWSETPTALQQGVIDAVEPTPNAWVASKIYELVDNITVTDYCFDFYVVGANKQWWQGLSKDVRAGVQGALDAATAWNWENAKKINDESDATIKAAGVGIHTLTPAQKALWVKAVQPVWKSLGTDLVGPKVMARLQEISAKYK
jgi:C4-dicarboxylate-binding protein DctP